MRDCCLPLATPMAMQVGLLKLSMRPSERSPRGRTSSTRSCIPAICCSAQGFSTAQRWPSATPSVCNRTMYMFLPVLADVLDRLGRIEEAAGAAERAVALAPDDEALTRRLDALRDRLAAQVEPAVGALATNTQPPAAAPALAVRPSPPLAASPARPAPKRSAFGFLSW